MHDLDNLKMWTVILALLPLLFILMVGEDLNFPSANGQTKSLMAGNVGIEYDNTFFDITDVSIKYDDVWGPTMIGLIQNKEVLL